MQKIVRTGTLRASSDLPERTYEFVISTEDADRHNTVFYANGWDFDHYRSNPVVAYNHNTGSNDPDDIIGTSEIRQEGNITIATLTLEEGNKKADKVARKIENGTLSMASVGAYPLEARWGDHKQGEDPDKVYFTRQELLEWSVVAVGSNREALKRSAESIEEFKQTIPKKGRSLETRKRQLNKLKLK